MTKLPYHSLSAFIDMIDEPNRSVCKQLYADHEERFLRARGSSRNHQAWMGGYLEHLEEVMNIAALLYESLHAARKLPFSLQDALLVLYLHDVEKPWRYIQHDDGSWEYDPDLKDKRKTADAFRDELIEKYGFELSDEQRNALDYVEGEKDDYTPGRRTQLPLAAFVHLCDTWSARGWYDQPKKPGSW